MIEKLKDFMVGLFICTTVILIAIAIFSVAEYFKDYIFSGVVIISFIWAIQGIGHNFRKSNDNTKEPEYPL